MPVDISNDEAGARADFIASGTADIDWVSQGLVGDAKGQLAVNSLLQVGHGIRAHLLQLKLVAILVEGGDHASEGASVPLLVELDLNVVGKS